jgi:hypothetical protein
MRLEILLVKFRDLERLESRVSASSCGSDLAKSERSSLRLPELSVAWAVGSTGIILVLTRFCGLSPVHRFEPTGRSSPRESMKSKKQPQGNCNA